MDAADAVAARRLLDAQRAWVSHQQDLAQARMLRLLQTVSTGTDIEPYRVAVLDLWPAMTLDLAGLAGSQAADVYEAQRELAALRGSFRATGRVAADLTAARLERQALWALKTMLGAAPDKPATAERLADMTGGAMRRSVETTVLQATHDDRHAESGLARRVAAPGACSWCRMLASRGAVYLRTDTAKHGGTHFGTCRCTVAPGFAPPDPHEAEHRAAYAAARDRVGEALAEADDRRPITAAMIVAEMDTPGIIARRITGSTD